ncbi:hypothetical protein M0R45_035842 [Rubus argutus]|uniref:Uncharacterized protein n=1 Tax=Rubus argutus TaxID=59490 RepID=A0AAW1VZK5_RUBAR
MHLSCFKACTQSQSHYTCLVCSKSSGATTMASTQSSLPVDVSFWVNMLYQIVLWFEHRQKAKERCLLCCVVLFALVLLCVLSTLVILPWFNPLGRNKFVYLL